MIIDEVKKNVAKRLLGKKSYIAGIGLLVLQQQNNKGEAYLTKKREIFHSVLETGKFKIKDCAGTPSDKTSLPGL